MEQLAKWRAVATATGPADRAAAEDGVRRAYRAAGLAQPRQIVWAASPRAAVEAVRADTGRGRSVREEIRTRPWERARRAAHDLLGPQGYGALWASTGAPLWEGTAALADRIRSGVAEALADGAAEREREVRLLLLDAVLGQHDAPWLAAFADGAAELAPLADVARHAGWWWPYEQLVVVCERPAELHRDEAGRLDRGDGPALVFPDGFALYAWRGMPVPAAFLARLGDLTPQDIRTEENAELRRVMLEHYGYERYLAESGAKPVHRDATGVLWRIELERDEPVVMVEVVNSTAEPDGSFRTYWLRVPPTTLTAREGVAWTFGLSAEAYDPVRQT
ncbi:DUF6745 domain-containing protein [Streptomyces sp. NPDC090022]|uniref:DUF6745 domain-containing protein n=1 Tax=Streptomyces sp. NPDC090022 TaxID=3365920 RepID=UPI00381A39D7